MTIVYCTDTLYRSGGIESVLTQKANYLAEQLGYRIYIVTFHQKGRKPFFKLSEKVGLIDLDINIRFPFRQRRYMNKLGALLEKVGADVCVSLCGVELFPISKMETTCAKIAEFHFSYQSYLIRGKQYRLPAFIKAASRMNKFVVLTMEDAAVWGKYLDNVVQIYNPSDIKEFSSTEENMKHCISGGRLVKQKNYDAMLKVWKNVSADFPEWKLDIYGSGPLQDHLSKLISKYSLEDSVTIYQPVGNFIEKIRNSSIYLMTSIYEGFPMVLIEAASAGVPAVSFACPTGPAEAIIDGQTGYVVKAGDCDAMASRIKKLMEDNQLRAKMGYQAKQQCSRFRIENIMKQWMNLFDSIASDKPISKL